MRLLKTLIVMLIPTCLLGCLQEEEEIDFARTPEGYAVHFTGISGTYTQDELLKEFDGAVIRAAGELYRYGVDPLTTEAVAHGAGYVIFDHIRFQVPDGRWAAGANFGKEIHLALHRRYSANAYPPEALPWTCFIHSSGEHRYGIWNPNDTYPALGHELGHTIFGPAFEHTYFPPIVNP